MSRYQISTGYLRSRGGSPDAGAVVRPRTKDRFLGAIDLTIRLDVEALDEQIQREAEHATEDHEAW